MSNKKMHYNFAECRKLALECPRNDKNYTDAQKYFFDRVIQVEGGLYYFDDGNLKKTSLDSFKKEKMRGFPNEFKKVIEENVEEYKEVLEFDDYRVDYEKKKINSLAQVYASTLKDVKVTQRGLDYVEFVKKYLFEIMAKEDPNVYKLLTQLSTAYVRRIKTGLVLAFITKTEGVGKSSYAEVMRFILNGIGECKNGLMIPVKARQMGEHNLSTYGKSLILLEETGALKQDVYRELMENMKNMATSTNWVYREVYLASQNLPCISNIVVTSNYEIGSDDGRRMFQTRISTKWEGREDMWSQLYDVDDEKIKALYDFFMSIDITGINFQTEAKKLKRSDDNHTLKAIENMPQVWDFVKEEFILNKPPKGNKIQMSEFYEKYKSSRTNGYKCEKLSLFDTMIGELQGIEKKVSTGNKMYYFIDSEKLYHTFKLKNLILKEEDNNIKGITQNNCEENTELFLMKENDELKKQLAEMKKQMVILSKQQDKQNKEIKEIKKVENKMTCHHTLDIEDMHYNYEQEYKELDKTNADKTIKKEQPETNKIINVKCFKKNTIYKK